MMRTLTALFAAAVFFNITSALAQNAPRDPNDVVAQVLNYSAFGNDQGLDYDYTAHAYFYALSKCVYALHDDKGEWLSLLPKSLDLQKLDPRLITFQSISNNGFVASVWTVYDTKPLIMGVGQLNIERLQRGWTLIYTKYCKGAEKPF